MAASIFNFSSVGSEGSRACNAIDNLFLGHMIHPEWKKYTSFRAQDTYGKPAGDLTRQLVVIYMTNTGRTALGDRHVDVAEIPPAPHDE